MTPERFKEIAEARVASCLALLIPKGEEYSRGGDRLHNFKTAGQGKGETPARALWGMYIKHWVSVRDMIDDMDRGIFPTPAMLKEKFNDSINYHLLLEGVVEDMQGQDEPHGSAGAWEDRVHGGESKPRPKPILITGKPGVGKTTMARGIAEKVGRYVVCRMADISNVFTLGSILGSGGAVQTLIVEHYDGNRKHDAFIRMLTTEPFIRTQRRGHDVELMPAPRFIFIADGPGPCNNELFSMRHCNGGDV